MSLYSSVDTCLNRIHLTLISFRVSLLIICGAHFVGYTIEITCPINNMRVGQGTREIKRFLGLRGRLKPMSGEKGEICLKF